MSLLNREQMMEFLTDPHHRCAIYAPTFVVLGTEPQCIEIEMDPDWMAGFIEGICDTAYEDFKTPWQKVLFRVRFSSNTMYLEVNEAYMNQ